MNTDELATLLLGYSALDFLAFGEAACGGPFVLLGGEVIAFRFCAAEAAADDLYCAGMLPPGRPA